MHLRLAAAALLSLATVVAATLSWDKVNKGSVAFYPMGSCGNGEQAYVGLLNPATLSEPDKFFIEVQGGAVCFSRQSCLNPDIGLQTMSITTLLQRMSTPDSMITYLKSGASIPFSLFAQLPNPGYLPIVDSHPMWGRRGAYVISCTGDVNLGHRNITYTDGLDYPVLDTCNESLAGGGSNYRGCQNRTKTGLPCMKWDEAKHSLNMSQNGLGSHNFCRHVDDGYNRPDNYIFCYTDTIFGLQECSPVGVDLKPLHALHVGGKSMNELLDAAHSSYPNLTEIAIYGGSGGGVSSAAWLPIIADIWQSANVTALVDSGLHIIPGTQLFQDFYDKAPWGPGPAGQGDGVQTVAHVPDFDWRKVDAVASHVASFDGRVKIAYLSCIDDHIVYSDRQKLATYANLDRSVQTLIDPAAQHQDSWDFLATLHECVPEGAAFSYIQDCTKHHQTRGGWGPDVPGSNVSAKQFAEHFLTGSPPNPENVSRTKFWYKSVANTGAGCSSEVRRRRVTPTKEPPTTTTKEPTTTTKESTDTTKKSTDTTKESTNTTKESTDTTKKPTDTTKESTDTTKEPTGTTKDTTGATPTPTSTPTPTPTPTNTTDGVTSTPSPDPTVQQQDASGTSPSSQFGLLIAMLVLSVLRWF